MLICGSLLSISDNILNHLFYHNQIYFLLRKILCGWLTVASCQLSTLWAWEWIIYIREIMSAPVVVDGVSLLSTDANSFSYSSLKPIPFLSYNAGFFLTQCVVVLGDMVRNGWFVEFLLWSFRISSGVMLQTCLIWFFFVFFFSGLKHSTGFTYIR